MCIRVSRPGPRILPWTKIRYREGAGVSIKKPRWWPGLDVTIERKRLFSLFKGLK
jgi:hypothetical protein